MGFCQQSEMIHVLYFNCHYFMLGLINVYFSQSVVVLLVWTTLKYLYHITGSIETDLLLSPHGHINFNLAALPCDNIQILEIAGTCTAFPPVP